MSRFRRLFRLQRSVQDEVNFELQHHLELSTERLIAEGLPPEAAHTEAMRRLGAHDEAAQRLYAAARERERRIRWIDRFDTAYAEARYVLRGFRRQRALTALIVLTLALGIGANASIFPIADRLLFRIPPGLSQPDELHRVYARYQRDSGEGVQAGFNFVEYTEMHQALGGRAPLALHWPVSFRIDGDTAVADRVQGAYISANYFSVLGVPMARGRYFAPDEDDPPNPRYVAIISHDLWQNRFGGDQRIVGRKMTVGSREYEVIGVVAKSFSGIDIAPTHVWTPTATQGLFTTKGPWWESRSGGGWNVISRVRGDPDILERDLANALGEGRRLAGSRPRQYTVEFGSIIEGRGPTAPTEARMIATRLMGVSIVLLLVALANVTNLLLAREAKREREIAVRRALGVSRGRLVATFLTEAVVLAGLAALVATAFSAALSGVVRSLLLPTVNWNPPVVDMRAILFTGVLGVACAIAAGLVCAARVIRSGGTLFTGAGQRGAGARRPWLSNSLLGAQAALSAVLLIGAALFVVSLDRMRNADLGYDIERTGWISPESGDIGAQAALQQLALSLAGRADVEGVALSTHPPLRVSIKNQTFINGSDSSVANSRLPDLAGVSPGFFEMMRLAIVRGRSFTADDRRGAEWVAIVNEEAARALWPGQIAIGQCVRIGARTNPCYTVVGVAENARRFAIVESPVPQLWVPLEQADAELGTIGALVVRARLDVVPTLTPLAEEYAQLTGSRTPPRVRTYAEWMDPQLREWRLGAKLFGAVSLLALTLAVVGLYSVLSASVAHRSGEIGIRLALGATANSVVRLILAQGLRVVAIGIAIGLVGAAASSKLIASLLYGVSARSPMVYGAVALTLLVAAAVAALIPARRAGRVDPTRVMRGD